MSPRAPGGLSSPPNDTQPFSQLYPPHARAYAVDDEEGEGVWGYLVPFDQKSGDKLVLRRRSACPVPGSMVGKTSGRERVSPKEYTGQEETYENEKAEWGVNAGGYLVGRHPECGKKT
jgi:serine/threonine-protein kinase Chk2